MARPIAIITANVAADPHAHALAAEAAQAGAPLPPRYHAHAKLWFALGWPAFLGVLAIFRLMIATPEL